MGSWSGPPTRRTLPASTASRETRSLESASRSSAGRVGRVSRAGRTWGALVVHRSCRGRTVGREHRCRTRAPYMCISAATRGSPHIAVPSPPHISLPCACPTRANVDGRRLARAPPRKEGPSRHDPARDRLDRHPRYGPARRAPAGGYRFACPRGRPWETSSDAYLQDYHVRQFRSQSTARGRDRPSHRRSVGRAARAAALTTHLRFASINDARRAAGAIPPAPSTGRPIGPPPHVHARRPLGLARRNVPRASPTASARILSGEGFFEHPEYLAVRAHLPAPWQDDPRSALGYSR